MSDLSQAPDNMDLWNHVSKTNPKHTKRVKLGREFTAIDPYTQIREATRTFGPAGKGWGWELLRVEHLPSLELGVLVRLWHGTKDQFIEQWGQCGYYINRENTKVDEDCFKKATTDAITKCLSYLGFNADVFTGQFDDNKYVATVRAEFDEKEKVEAAAKEASKIKVEPTRDENDWFLSVKTAVEKAVTDASMGALNSLYRDTVTEYSRLTRERPGLTIIGEYKALFADAKRSITAKTEVRKAS